jgi:periplasmic copper chaperone A
MIKPIRKREMRKIAMFVLAGMLLLSACGAPMSGAVEAKDAWARTGMMGGNSAAYMMLVNGTAQDDELIGASSDAADAVEIHLSQMGADNVMQMIKQKSVQIPARKMLELKPGSYHVMMIGLKRDLNVGDSITLTLHFRNYGDVTLTVPVKDAADMGGSGMDGHNTMP